VKLLRVLEERTVRRIGSRASRAVDVRFVSATNRDLWAEVQQRTFRADLFFRLNGMALTVPPLRARPGDIEDLAALFAARAAQEAGRPDVPRISPEARDLLLRHDWPGNVRELRNAVEHAVVLCSGPQLLPEHLPQRLVAAPAPSRGTLRERVDAAEQEQVLLALERCGGNQTLAAAELGISRRTLVTRLSEWGLTQRRRRPA
jgi:DNA-binding NtrC family response regulator